MFTLPPHLSPYALKLLRLARRGLWLVPFLFFIIGYYITQRTVGSRVLQAPHLIGKELHDAVRILAPYRLNLRILDEVEEPAMAEGTIIDQKPAPGQNIKIYQPLGIVISRQPKPLTAPDFVGMSLPEIEKQIERESFRIKTHFCKSDVYPAQQCIAQTPGAGELVTDKTVNVYISSEDTVQYILPNFVGLPLNRVIAFLNTHHMPVEIIPQEYVHHTHCPQCVVTAQKPLAESFISRTKPPTVQLRVEHK